MRPLRAIGLLAAGTLTAVGLLGVLTIGLPILAAAGASFALLGRRRGLSAADASVACAGAALVFLGVGALAPSGVELAIYVVPAAIAAAGAMVAALIQRRRCSGRA